MLLLTKEIRNKIPKLYEQDGKGDAAEIAVKFFTPWAGWTWYATEGEPVLDEDGNEIDFRFFGLVDGDFEEFGYWLLSELKSVDGPFGLKIERDRHFRNKTIGDVKK